MIPRRLYEHVRTHNWFAVAIDLLIVVLGVFIGIQVANWNVERLDRSRAQHYLKRISADLQADVTNYRFRIGFWEQVGNYGRKAVSYADGGDADGMTQWQLLLAFFQASQLYKFYTTDATYEELKSAGELELVDDIALRDSLAAYYTLARDPVFAEQPEYRRRVRGIIPLEVQTYIWTDCWTIDTAFRQTLKDCPAPIDEIRAADVVNSLRRDSAVISDLRYWVSTMDVASHVAQERMASAEELRTSIDKLLDGP